MRDSVSSIARVGMCWLMSLVCVAWLSVFAVSAEPLRVGVAVADITPPVGFPMAGYFHERLADGTLDPLQAKAVVFQQGDQKGALVLCDLIGIAVDLNRVVRQRAAQATGIPAEHIVLAATHSHTAPDYAASLYQYLARHPDLLSPSALPHDRSAVASTTTLSAEVGKIAESTSEGLSPLRAAYIEKLLSQVEQAIVQAHQSAVPQQLSLGTIDQETPVSFNRRFVQRDGTIKTWIGLEDPNSVRQAGPIDPSIGLLLFRPMDGQPKALLSNFALHLDTVGGLHWSADYPGFIEKAVQEHFGKETVSLFGTGCCGDINHVPPRGKERNKTEVIGNALARTILAGIEQLEPCETTQFSVHASVAQLPLQKITVEEVREATQRLEEVAAGKTIDFYEHVTAHKRLLVDQLTHVQPLAGTGPVAAARRITHSWAGVGASLPVDLNVFCFGDDLAIVCVPGEVFVELGLAIKQASPFRQTMVIELANCVETCYIPTRAACVGGGYEPTNSTVEPGSGEILVAEVMRLLQAARRASDGSAGASPAAADAALVPKLP